MSMGLSLVLVAAQAATTAVPPVSAADPTRHAVPRPATPQTPPSRLFGRSSGTSQAQAGGPRGLAVPVPAAGFDDTIVMSGLTRPVAIRFASNGSVFVAEKSGLIKMFSSPTIIADRRGRPAKQSPRLLGSGLDGVHPRPELPGIARRAYVLYAYDAPIGGTAPTYGDGCPPPGANTDGCFVSGRLSRLTIDDGSSTEQVLINDWCQQFPSHSVGDLRLGPDGALYATGGEGASFIGVDFGQFGGTT